VDIGRRQNRQLLKKMCTTVCGHLGREAIDTTQQGPAQVLLQPVSGRGYAIRSHEIGEASQLDRNVASIGRESRIS
jgi:hypothetical protein